MDVPPFVDLAWLVARPHALLVEVRHDAPEPATAPGVLDLDRDLAGPATPQDGRHPLPTPEAFADVLTRAGVGDDDDVVVAHDEAGGVFAARLVWMLRATGRAAALLDGGPAPSRPVPRPREAASARPWPAELLAGLDEVTDPGLVVLDARPRERYLGAPSPLDPRPGHLPGARSLPCRDNVGADGRLLPVEVLRERLHAAGADPGVPVVSTCGSGVTACHTLLVLEHVGAGPGRLYPGSWSQYAADPDRPVALGEDGTSG